MAWEIEYYERADGWQPAESYEDDMSTRYPKLYGKLLACLEAIAEHGQRLGGGYIETCRNYAGLWEARAIFNGFLARELLGFDGQRVVLLHGYTKRVGEVASQGDLQRAHDFWGDYQRTRRISPEEEEDNE